jgi:hypothetical protein
VTVDLVPTFDKYDIREDERPFKEHVEMLTPHLIERLQPPVVGPPNRTWDNPLLKEAVKAPLASNVMINPKYGPALAFVCGNLSPTLENMYREFTRQLAFHHLPVDDATESDLEATTSQKKQGAEKKKRYDEWPLCALSCLDVPCIALFCHELSKCLLVFWLSCLLLQ